MAYLTEIYCKIAIIVNWFIYFFNVQLTRRNSKNNISLQARIQKKLDEELPQERMGGMKQGPKVSGNQGLSKS